PPRRSSTEFSTRFGTWVSTNSRCPAPPPGDGARSARRRSDMIPSAFEYGAPTSTADAVELLSGAPMGAKILAGGQSFIPVLRLLMADLELVVGLAKIHASVWRRSRVGTVPDRKGITSASGR